MDGFARLSIEDAAHRLGLSVSTVRRRIRAGSVAVEREETPQGYRYVVLVPKESDGSAALPEESAPASDRLAELIAERDWLRRRVEELTTLLNREQEVVLRLSAAHNGRALPPADTDEAAPVPTAGFVAQSERQVEPDVTVAPVPPQSDAFVLAARVRRHLKDAGVPKKVRRRLMQRLRHIVGG